MDQLRTDLIAKTRDDLVERLRRISLPSGLTKVEVFPGFDSSKNPPSSDPDSIFIKYTSPMTPYEQRVLGHAQFGLQIYEDVGKRGILVEVGRVDVNNGSLDLLEGLNETFRQVTNYFTLHNFQLLPNYRNTRMGGNIFFKRVS